MALKYEKENKKEKNKKFKIEFADIYT